MEELEKASLPPLTSFAGMGFVHNPLPCPRVVCPAVKGPRGHVVYVLTSRPANKSVASRTPLSVTEGKQSLVLGSCSELSSCFRFVVFSQQLARELTSTQSKTVTST